MGVYVHAPVLYKIRSTGFVAHSTGSPPVSRRSRVYENADMSALDTVVLEYTVLLPVQDDIYNDTVVMA